MNCINCLHEFKENEGRYQHSDGTLCIECENNIEEINLVSDEIIFDANSNFSFLENQKLGQYTIDGELLAKYAHTVTYLKFFTTIDIGKPEMFIVDNIIREKELILKELFTNVNMTYDSTDMDANAQKFLKQINAWTKLTVKCAAN